MGTRSNEFDLLATFCGLSAAKLSVRDELEGAQRGNRRSKTRLRGFENLFIASPAALAKRAIRHAEQKVHQATPDGLYLDRTAAAAIAARFHRRAGTLTPRVTRNLCRLSSGAPLIRVAHTPDHFPYTGLYCQLIALDIASQHANTCSQLASMFLVIDTDEIRDRRLTTSFVPDLERRDGVLRISADVGTLHPGTIIRCAPSPSTETIRVWEAVLKRYIEHSHIVTLRKGAEPAKEQVYLARLDWLSREIRESARRSENLADFNMIFLSRVTNLYWNLETIFVNSSSISPLLEPAWQYWMLRSDELAKVTRESVRSLEHLDLSVSESQRRVRPTSLFWLVCNGCGVRFEGEKLEHSLSAIHGTCPKCGTAISYYAGSVPKDGIGEELGVLYPRVIIDELTDIVSWKIAGGINYIGGVDHTLLSYMIAKKIGVRPPPELLWRPRAVRCGLPELQILARYRDGAKLEGTEWERSAIRCILSGKASILYSVLSRGIDGVYQQWINHFSSGGTTYQVVDSSCSEPSR